MSHPRPFLCGTPSPLKPPTLDPLALNTSPSPPRPHSHQIERKSDLRHTGGTMMSVVAMRRVSGLLATRAAAGLSTQADKELTKIDWDGMGKMIVSEEAKKEFYNLRRTFEEVNHALKTKFSLEPQPIDWEKYRKGIGSKLVDMYKEAYDSIEIPKYVDTVTPQFKPKFEALLKEFKEAEELSLKESERLEKEIAEVQELKKKISTMTADEYFEKHPELRKKFDDEMRNDYWGY